MNLLKSKLALSILLLSLITIGLSSWGLYNSSNSKKDIDKYLAQQRQAFEASQQSLLNAKAQTALNTDNTGSVTSSSTQTKATPKSTTSPTSPPLQISDEVKEEATFKLASIQNHLEVYYTQNGYYPSDIAPSNFTETCSGSGCGSEFTPPTGLHFVYKPTVGCTTAAKNCLHWTLDAVDSAGNPVVAQKRDLNY